MLLQAEQLLHANVQGWRPCPFIVERVAISRRRLEMRRRLGVDQAAALTDPDAGVSVKSTNPAVDGILTESAKDPAIDGGKDSAKEPLTRLAYRRFFRRFYRRGYRRFFYRRFFYRRFYRRW